MKVEIYFDEDGFSPYYYWLSMLQDKVIQQRILVRLDRVMEGNFGDHKSLGENLWELRMVFGGGTRVYYGYRGKDLILLLGGGNKSSQERDIKKARLLWQKFLGTNK